MPKPISARTLFHRAWITEGRDDAPKLGLGKEGMAYARMSSKDVMDQPGGFYRIRATGKPAYVVTDLHATKRGVDLVFSDPLDAKTAADAANFKVTTWSLLRSAKYGSARLNVKELTIAGASLGEDRDRRADRNQHRQRRGGEGGDDDLAQRQAEEHGRQDDVGLRRTGRGSGHERAM